MVGSHPRLPIPPQAHGSVPTRTNRRESSCANGKRSMQANGKVSANPNQHARFIKTFRTLECDEDEAAFDEKLKAVVGPKATDAVEKIGE